MLQDFVDCAFDAVALKFKEGLPNPGVHDLDVLVKQATLLLIGKEVLKDMEQGFEVDEFRGVVRNLASVSFSDFLLSAPASSMAALIS